MVEELTTLLNMDPNENPDIDNYFFYGFCEVCGVLDLIPFSTYPTTLCDSCWINDEDYLEGYQDVE